MDTQNGQANRETGPLDIENKRQLIKKMLSTVEPMIHEVYGRTNFLHDSMVLTKFVEVNLWIGLADRSQITIEKQLKGPEYPQGTANPQTPAVNIDDAVGDILKSE